MKGFKEVSIGLKEFEGNYWDLYGFKEIQIWIKGFSVILMNLLDLNEYKGILMDFM